MYHTLTCHHGQMLPSTESVFRPSTIFKDVLLQNRYANQSQFLYGASMGRGDESFFLASGSHDLTKMGFTPIYSKILYKSTSPELVNRFPRNLVCSIGSGSFRLGGFGPFFNPRLLGPLKWDNLSHFLWFIFNSVYVHQNRK